MATGGNVQGNLSSTTQPSVFFSPEVERTLHILEPMRTPFTQYLYFGSRSQKPAFEADGYFKWGEDQFYPWNLTISASTGGGAGATGTITFTDGSALVGDEILYVESTDQMVRCTSMASANVANISTINGSTTFVAPTNATLVKIMAGLMGEQEIARTATSTIPTLMQNIMTMISEDVAMTGRAESGKYLTTGQTFPEKLRKRILEIKLQLERWFILSNTLYRGAFTVQGVSDEVTIGYGLQGLLTTNVQGYTGPLLSADLDTFFKAVFQYGTGEKILYQGTQQLYDLNNVVKGYYQVTGIPAREFGVDVVKYVIPGQAKLTVVYDPVMDGKFGGAGFAIDPGDLVLRYQGPDTTGPRGFRVTNVKLPNVGGSKKQILADVGIQYNNQETGGLLHQTDYTGV